MKVAIVTGSSYGLGEAITKKLLLVNYKVYGVSRTKPKIKSEKLFWIEADLADTKNLKTVIEKISENKIDLLVNNAGTAFPQKTHDYTDEDFEKMYGLNFKSPAKLTALLLPKLKHGLIINISSLSDRYPDPDFGLYGSSKAALNLYFETMAAENPEIKIINILPSYIDTPLQHQIRDDKFDYSVCMSIDEVANSISEVIIHSRKYDTGSRVAIVKDVKDFEGDYYPEKLWIHSTENKKIVKIK